MAIERVELLLTVEEGNQFISCSLGAEGKSNCGEPVNRVESEQNIVVLANSREPKVSTTSQEERKKSISRRGTQIRKKDTGRDIP